MLGTLLFCHVESPGEQWTGAQIGGTSLADARKRKQWTRAPIEGSFTSFDRILQKVLENSRPVHFLKSSCASFSTVLNRKSQE